MNELEESLREYGFRSSVTITIDVDHDDQNLIGSEILDHLQSNVSPEMADEWNFTIHKTESNARPEDLAEAIAQSVYQSMNDHAWDVGHTAFKKLRSLGDEATKKAMDEHSDAIMSKVWSLLRCKGE